MALETIKDISVPSLQCNPLRIVGGVFVCGCAAGVDTGGAHQDIGTAQNGGQKIEVNTLGLISSKTSIDIENLELPPLSVFLDAVTENASVKRAQSQVEQVKNQYRLEKGIGGTTSG